MTESTPAQSRWTTGRVLALVFGSIFGLIGLAGTLGGGVLTVAAATQRDSQGYFTTDAKRLSVGSYAITSDDMDLHLGSRARDLDLGDILRFRFRATPVEGERAVFIGVARASDVDRYLKGVAHDVIKDADLDPFRVEYRAAHGEQQPSPPGDESIWVKSASGRDRTTLTWEPKDGTWTVVIMNADASRGVDARIDVGVHVNYLWWVAGGLLGAGIVMLALGIFLIIRGSHPQARPPSDAVVAPPVPVAAAAATADEPVVLSGRIDEPLHRWLWLVKWLLAIPHLIVLAILWVVMILLTIVAAFAILFTGRYPRGIFDFNVGVLRWTWRVSFYAGGALGTDRYPPFTLGAEPDYPATLDVAYPEQLSRGLVLVKWWLLAIPHYVIVGIIGSGWWFGHLTWWGDRWSARGWGYGGGLLGILVLVAAVRLLFSARYPRDMFGLILGLNRWVYRVAAYALLMTDRYPPFRLDQDAPAEAPSAAR